MKTNNIEKKFDCIKMKEEIQRKILLETKGMTDRETLDYFNYTEWRQNQTWIGMLHGQLLDEAVFPQKPFGLENETDE
ncbi:hypothetical protein FACS1894172_18380 [Spirochaetia bacterium]|nr:hypothetical protein FACS1894172_18380 [Spirochaetia bacterium]